MRVTQTATLVLATVAIVGSHASAEQSAEHVNRLAIFDNERIGFGDGQSREIQKTIQLPPVDANSRLVLNIDIDPDKDPWDKAGSLHLILEDGRRVQLMPFITGFMGDTDHSRDITALLPLLRTGPVKVEAFIDTWVKDGWRFSASIDVVPAKSPAQTQPAWAAPAIPLDTGFDKREPRDFTVDVPPGMDKIVLTYFATGHHREDKGNSDEFHKRRHHLLVNGKEVWTEIPWRTDGPKFRHVNPRSGRWDRDGDGKTNSPYPKDAWSSDFPRSGWIPGDQVHPYEIDLTEHLKQGGPYTITLKIDDIDKDSFWRVSAYFSGWKK